MLCPAGGMKNKINGRAGRAGPVPHYPFHHCLGLDKRGQFSACEYKEKQLQPFVLVHLHGQLLMLTCPFVPVLMIQVHIMLYQKTKKRRAGMMLHVVMPQQRQLAYLFGILKREASTCGYPKRETICQGSSEHA